MSTRTAEIHDAVFQTLSGLDRLRPSHVLEYHLNQLRDDMLTVRTKDGFKTIIFDGKSADIIGAGAGKKIHEASGVACGQQVVAHLRNLARPEGKPPLRACYDTPHLSCTY